MDFGISSITAMALMPTRRIGTSPSASCMTGSLGRSCWFGGGETLRVRDRIALKRWNVPFLCQPNRRRQRKPVIDQAMFGHQTRGSLALRYE